MKKLILEHLKTFSEGRLARHTTSNPSFNGKTFFFTPEELRYEITKANEIYRENSVELGATNQGDGLYEFILYPAGKGKWGFGGKMSSIGSKREPGTTNRSQGGQTLYLYIMANRGMVHPEYELDAGPQQPKTHSPMSQANVKVLALMGDEIMRFIDDSLGYDDGKGAELQKQKMDPKWAYKLDREKKEKERQANKGKISMDADKSSLYNDIQAKLAEKVAANRSGDRAEVRRLTREIKLLKKKLETL